MSIIFTVFKLIEINIGEKLLICSGISLSKIKYSSKIYIIAFYIYNCYMKHTDCKA